MTRFLSEHRLFVILIIAYTLLCLAFSLNSPIFEAPDEIEHFRYIRTLIQTGTLPDPAGQPRGQYHQPPLYYLLHAPLLALLDDRGFEQIDGRKNPFYGFHFEIPGGDNKNEYVHTRAEAFPYADSPIARTIHLLRLVSIVLGAGTIFVGYRIFCLVWGSRAQPAAPLQVRRLLATGFVCFMPQFVYLSGHLNNDNLMMLLSTLILWWLLSHHGKAIAWRQAALFGILCGAAALTRSSAAFLALPVLVALLFNRQWWRFMPVMVLFMLTVCGWYYARNLLLYGDLTNLNAWQQTWSFDVIHQGQFVPDIAIQNFPYVYFTFWGRFGSGAVTFGDFYGVFGVVTLLTVTGLTIQLSRNIVNPTTQYRNEFQQGIIVTAFAASWLLVAFYLSGIAWAGNQGRYLLPGIAAWAMIVTYGISAFIPRLTSVFAAGAVICVWAGIILFTFFNFFLPAYCLENIPAAIEHPLNIRYAEVAELIGVSQTTLKAQPGEVIRVTLYWRALAETDTFLHVFVHSQDSDIVRRDSLPGAGKLLATDWRPGDTWAETYLIPVPIEAERQRVYPLIVGLYESETQNRLPVTDSSGKAITPAVIRLVIHGEPSPVPQIAYRFGDAIGLTAPEIQVNSENIEICLTWIALDSIPQDYMLFIHLIDSGGSIVGQYDAQPRSSRYPTGVWLPRESIAECMSLTADNNAVTDIAIGLYRAQDFSRLPVVDSTENSLPDNRILLPLPED